jgi:hypothetical protein
MSEETSPVQSRITQLQIDLFAAKRAKKEALKPISDELKGFKTELEQAVEKRRTEGADVDLDGSIVELSVRIDAKTRERKDVSKAAQDNVKRIEQEIKEAVAEFQAGRTA